MNGADVFLGCSARRADGRDGQDHGPKAHHPGTGQPEPGNPPRAGEGRARLTASSPRAARTTRNQVNNVLCFPYIFRGALDCGATKITEAIGWPACARSPTWPRPTSAKKWPAPMRAKELTFGPDYLDPHAIRLAPTILKIARRGQGRGPAWPAPHRRHGGLQGKSLSRFVYQTGILMRPVINAAKALPDAQKRVAGADGEGRARPARRADGD